MVGTFDGVRQVEHSGSTAGYRAHLARYPDQHVSVAVLCNVDTANATQAAHAVARVYLGDRARQPDTPRPAYTLTADDLQRLAGSYRDRTTGVPVTIVALNGGLVVGRGQSDGLTVQRREPLVPMSASEFVTSDGRRWTFDQSGAARVVDTHGTADEYEHVAIFTPTPAQLAEYAGVYTSDEAETLLTVAVQGERLVVKRRPDTVIPLTPAYLDAFDAGPLGLVVFRRDATRITALSVVQDRVWNLRFDKHARGNSEY
jgi:hypothetical protein